MHLGDLSGQLSYFTPSEEAVELQGNQRYRGCSTRKLTYVGAILHRSVYLDDIIFSHGL